jgi:hypothetical protein
MERGRHFYFNPLRALVEIELEIKLMMDVILNTEY